MRRDHNSKWPGCIIIGNYVQGLTLYRPAVSKASRASPPRDPPTISLVKSGSGYTSTSASIWEGKSRFNSSLFKTHIILKDSHLANRRVVVGARRKEDVMVSVVLQHGCAGQEEFCRLKSDLFRGKHFLVKYWLWNNFTSV